jgi:hypothetical protein
VITHPSTSELIEQVRQQLSQGVAPAIDNEQLLGLLGMIDALLQRASVRAEFEIEWMREEISAIEQLGAGPGACNGRIAEAMAALRAGQHGSNEASAVTAEYRLAGEVLSRGLESGGEVAAASQVILDQRLAREAEILGDFALVARD